MVRLAYPTADTSSHAACSRASSSSAPRRRERPSPSRVPPVSLRLRRWPVAWFVIWIRSVSQQVTLEHLKRRHVSNKQEGSAMSTATAADERIDPALRKLIWILILGALAPALDTTIVNVALATLGRALHTSIATSQWTITGYLLAMGMAMPVTGWLSERFGGKRMWLLSLTLFLAGSALSGAAWTVGSLIVFRVVQGAAAGLMMPIVTTLLVQAAGPKRLGGMMAIAKHPLDVLGLALLSPGLALIIYGLSRVTGRGGFGGTGVLVPLAAGLALTAAFMLHAVRRRERPLINLSVPRVGSYAASVSVLFLAGLSVYGPLLLLALYYQQSRARAPWRPVCCWPRRASVRCCRGASRARSPTASARGWWWSRVW